MVLNHPVYQISGHDPNKKKDQSVNDIKENNRYLFYEPNDINKYVVWENAEFFNAKGDVTYIYH